MRSKILITGGAGFIGSHLADRLIKDGYDVFIIDNLSTGRKENLNPKAKFYNADICDNSLISAIFKKENPEIVFHLAAQINVRKSIENPIFDTRVNMLGTLNILENCRNHKIKKVIFASTGGAIYGETDIIPTSESCFPNPLSPYGINKLLAESYLNYYYQLYNLSFVSLRLSNVYGPRQNSEGEAGVISIFCDKMLKGEQPIIFGNGTQTRDFVFVYDVIDAFISAMKKNKTGIFNIGTSKETDINTIFEKVKGLTGSKFDKKYGKQIKGEQKRSCLNYSLAKKELNWQPKYSLDDGLKETVKWFKLNKKHKDKKV